MNATITPYRLWEIEHPHYCETSRWCEHQGNPRFTSWADFTDSAFYDGDRDQNLLIRWDWDTHDDYNNPDSGEQVHDLLLFFVLQRKPIFTAAKVRVQPAGAPPGAATPSNSPASAGCSNSTCRRRSGTGL
ncbi:hypothetical protein FHR83_006820 [Actinoplanes campanulatus]|uniref:Uncharacterized protein n=1 Tax=Actinoplanes campanulatus TaxID=113559 RepID=A0A7W5FHY5_9ACTN|nr:hypothetical protein [Actinoplanes campanulatus]MBB3099114.1 hypothetical protein [Actinoplanes campanulatus]GGN38975.1 hypothetical protein GCM10010109_66390 [Actinoplanes campanulatus]GID40270.1 hypothetical protein Aca09nite_67760 [Actinoplanes campanulatus]